MREVVIVDGVRSAFTNFGGGLRTLASVDIASRVVDGLLKRTGILERGTVDGLIAMLYQQIWSKAEMREILLKVSKGEDIQTLI